MSQALEHHIPTLHGLPLTLPRDGAVQLELEEGVLIFRVSEAVQDQIEALLNKQRSDSLSVTEAEELQQYEDIDDYMSFVNRLVAISHGRRATIHLQHRQKPILQNLHRADSLHALSRKLGGA